MSEAGMHTLNPQPPLSSPDSTSLTPLTLGQPIMVHTSIKVLQMGLLELCDAKLIPNEEAGLMLVGDMTSQLCGWPLPMRCNDTLTLLLPMCPTKALEEAASLGRLRLTWRRIRPVGEPTVLEAVSEVQNYSGGAMEVCVTLLESKGFVLSGERAQSNSLGPRDSCTFMWLLVAHAAGHLLLPGIKVVATDQNCSL
eukprot:gene13773-19681_t